MIHLLLIVNNQRQMDNFIPLIIFSYEYYEKHHSVSS